MALFNQELMSAKNNVNSNTKSLITVYMYVWSPCSLSILGVSNDIELFMIIQKMTCA